MKKENKKYLIKESELKEIMQEMILTELYDPNDYAGMYTQHYKGRVPNLTDIGKASWGMIKGIPDALGGINWPDWLPDLGQNQGGSGGGGRNQNAEEVFYVNRACEWIKSHAYPRYDANTCKHCARNVRLALQAGGLGVPYGMYHNHAYNYLVILPQNGWQRININAAGQPGDVCVIAACVDVSGKKHVHGHISMCVGNGVWISDFVQSTMHGLAANPPLAAVYVFRYPNIQ